MLFLLQPSTLQTFEGSCIALCETKIEFYYLDRSLCLKICFITEMCRIKLLKFPESQIFLFKHGAVTIYFSLSTNTLFTNKPAFAHQARALRARRNQIRPRRITCACPVPTAAPPQRRDVSAAYWCWLRASYYRFADNEIWALADRNAEEQIRKQDAPTQ